jgi:hypothetical protein
MRKITIEAVKAFLNDGIFKKDNTRVENGRIFLHGNLIAEKRKDGIYISLAGWNTVTTRERLNGLPNVRINQKNYVPYLNGKAINSSEWYKI